MEMQFTVDSDTLQTLEILHYNVTSEVTQAETEYETLVNNQPNNSRLIENIEGE